jgi:hypothetical protein
MHPIYSVSHNLQPSNRLMQSIFSSAAWRQ